MTPVSSRVSNCSLTAAEPRSNRQGERLFCEPNCCISDLQPQGEQHDAKSHNDFKTGVPIECLGIAFVAASPLPAGQPRSTQEQSKASTSNSGRTTQKISLSWDVFLSPSAPVITSDLAPGEKQRPWPPISSTLISGERDAVLVDTPTTVEQARALANWVVASGKHLMTIYATHGHGDHFFGTSTVLERFPHARFVARPDVIKIAGHKRIGNEDSPRIIGETRKYIRDFERLA